MQRFKKVSLFPGQDSSGAKPTSLPLVLPNNVRYDPQTCRMTHLPAVQRTHLEIVPSTAALLSQIRESIAVLSVTGMARSGKSYILSRVLGSSDTFRLGHSMDPETFGIWIATQVLKNDNFTIVLVDTEGIDAASAEKKNDISLLVLTILLSSYFVFNTISVPKRAQLEDLECFVQLVNGLRVNKDGMKDYNKFPKVFPDFLWLLRDVNLIPTDETGKQIDAKTFLKERLLKCSGGFEETTSDKVARAIKMFFPSIDCMTLPVPSDDPDVMQHVETSEDKLTPMFNEGVNKVVEHILGNVKQKTGYKRGTNVTGSQLVCMLETYVEAVNTPNAIPVIETSWETSLRILADRFHQEAEEIYKKGMTAALDAQGEVPMEAGGTDGETLLSLHRKYYEMAQENVRKGLGPMCNEIELAKSMSRIQQVIFGSKVKTSSTDESFGLFHVFWQVNYEKSLLYCQKLQGTLYEPIAKKISESDKGYNYEKLKEDLKQLEVDYKTKSKGPAKQKVYADFTEFVNSEAKTFGKLQDFKEKEFVEQQKSAEMSTQLERMYEEQRRMESLMMEEMEENKTQAERLANEYNEKIDEMKEEERNAYVQRMSDQAETMQRNMMENMKMIKEMADKNKQFLEESLKMAQQERKADRERTMAMVEAMQERNAKIAKDMAQQVKKKSKNPLEQIGNLISTVTSLAGVLGPLLPKVPSVKSVKKK